MEDNLKGLMAFFSSDANIKNELGASAPNPDFSRDEDCIRYSDILVEASNNISFEMNNIFAQENLLIPDFIKEDFRRKLAGIKSSVQRAPINYDSLKTVYKSLFSDMDTDFIKEVGNVCRGYDQHIHYYTDGRVVALPDVVKKAHTINEMLHLVHSYVCNNEKVLDSIPVTAQKAISEYGNCSLMGLENNVAKGIYDSIPENDEDCLLGETYIVGLENRVLMMVRDVGHALTIDIEPDEEKNIAFVKYFVPKICDSEKFNKLKGANKVPVDEGWYDRTGTGAYEASLDDFGKDLYEFICEVPTDSDMLHDEYKNFEEQKKSIPTKNDLLSYKHLKGVLSNFLSRVKEHKIGEELGISE